MHARLVTFTDFAQGCPIPPAVWSFLFGHVYDIIGLSWRYLNLTETALTYCYYASNGEYYYVD